MKKKMSLKMLAVTCALGLAFVGPVLAQDDELEVEVEENSTLEETALAQANDTSNAVAAQDDSQSAGNDAIWVENEAEEGSQAGVAGNDVNNTKLEPEAEAEEESQAGVAGNDVNQTMDSQLAGNDIKNIEVEVEAENGSQAGVAGNDVNNIKTEVEAEEGGMAAIAGNDVKQVKIETEIEAEDGSQIAGGDAVNTEASGSNSIIAGGNVKSVKAESDSQIAGNDAIKADRGGQIAGGDAINIEAEEGGIAANGSVTKIEIEAKEGGIVANGNVTRVEAEKGSIVAGNDVKTLEASASHGSVAGGLVKIDFMAVNEGILNSSISRDNDLGVMAYEGEYLPLYGDNNIHNSNISNAGINQLAQNSGYMSNVQQNVSVQGNLNFAAALPAVVLPPVNGVQ